MEDELSVLHTPQDESVVSIVTADNPLNNWSAHSIRIWGKRFPTAEHAFQYKKAEYDPKMALKIKAAKSPRQAKQLSRQLTIDAERWNKQRKNVMLEILRAKLQQHHDVREALLATKTRAIVEDTLDDNYWGIDRCGRGRNMLGKIWMQLRDEIS